MSVFRHSVRVALNYGRIARELATAYPTSFPVKIGKVVYGRARYDVAPAVSVGMGLIELPPHHWKRFIHGRGRLEAFRIINLRLGAHLFKNKVALLDRIAQHGLPHARTYGLDELPGLGDADLFIKPPDEYGGKGAFAARADEPGLAERAEGLLIQDRLRSHPGLAPIGGDFGLPTLRVHTVLTPEGGRVVAVVAKILTGPDLIDNWHGGRTGKLIAGVDLDTGKLTQGFGLVPGTDQVIRPIDRHPTTGEVLRGFVLPEFEGLREIAQRLAEAFPDAPILGSDIALTTDGPVILDPNFVPEPNFPQITLREGVRDFLPRWIAMADIPSEVKRAAVDSLG
jgi:hypothetical protein